MVEKTYELNFDEDIRYHLKFGISKKNKLKISAIDINQTKKIYNGKYTIEELGMIDKYFNIYNSLEVLVKDIDDLISSNKLTMVTDDCNNLILQLHISVNDKERIAIIKLVEKGNEHMDALNDLTKLVQLQSQKLESIQKENYLLKNEIYRLNDKIENINLKSKKIKVKSIANEIMSKKIKKENLDSDSDNDAEDEKNELYKDIKKKKNKKKKDDEEEEEEEEEEDSDKDTKKKTKSKKSKKSKKSEEGTEASQVIDPKDIPPFNIDDIVNSSKIIKRNSELEFLINKINELLKSEEKKFVSMELIYLASEDGDTPDDFHDLCDNIRPLLLFVQTTQGKRFGGFTSKSFTSPLKVKGKKDNKSFIFNLDKLKIFDVIKDELAICSYKNYGPVFYGKEYCNIFMGDKFLKMQGNVGKHGDTFQTENDYEINDGELQFIAQEVEIYQIYKTA